MKKTYFLLIPIFLLLTSCGGNRYSIEGSVPENYNGTYAWLSDVSGIPVDSALVADGTLCFKGNADEPYLAQVMLVDTKSQSYDIVHLVVEPGKIHFKVDSEEVYTLSGTPLNDDLDYLLFVYSRDPSVKADYQRCKALMSRCEQGLASPEEMAEAERFVDSISLLSQKALCSRTIEMLKKHPNDILGVAAALFFYHPDDAAGSSGDPLLDAFSEAFEQCGDFVKQHPLLKQSSYQPTASVAAVGGRYLDFEGRLYGENRKATLGSLIDGHVALVDFWASWCRPCCQEISENLIRIYEAYKDKGLVVVGIDLNDDPARHDQTTRQLGITYPQIIDQDGKAAKLYAIDAIPQIFLIDDKGVIVASGLRGEAVEEAVKKALGIN